MNFILEDWLNELVAKLQNNFDNRILFIGYQGSYRRGEATPNSDVDMVVILDELNIEDLNNYRAIVKTMSYPEKTCGFICGKKEIISWPQGDVFQLLNDTQAFYGDLASLIPEIPLEAVEMSVRNNSANLYHMACHSYLYDEYRAQILIDLYKMTFFILQANHYIHTGKYIDNKKELTLNLTGVNKEILNTCINRANILQYNSSELENAYSQLIEWSSSNIRA